jgi:hypothetical protein
VAPSFEQNFRVAKWIVGPGVSCGAGHSIVDHLAGSKWKQGAGSCRGGQVPPTTPAVPARGLPKRISVRIAAARALPHAPRHTPRV